ncbi:hydrogenase maturation protease [Thermanaeromonas sp. C210]|uniref:hydrogenase maturation protease n=1 Tax=Thermanaeromonas sp. C210 TaxID=2731925 RepID=UPI00155C86DB|nr:hydrogenase maturation protease [Thermanaeromonas sp. C210]GFN23886.1 hypothetical protein TAMC210_22030 [Thermanaeromonas sp. C210]
MEVCVIGLGNELRRDDGVGVKVVDRLRSCYGTIKECDFFILANDLFSLPVLLEPYKKAVIVDAFPPGPHPGKLVISRFVPGIVERGPTAVYSLHDLDLYWHLQYALHRGYKGDIFLVGIETASLEPGIGLSPALKEKLPALTKQIRGFLAKLVKGLPEEDCGYELK